MILIILIYVPFSFRVSFNNHDNSHAIPARLADDMKFAFCLHKLLHTQAESFHPFFLHSEYSSPVSNNPPINVVTLRAVPPRKTVFMSKLVHHVKFIKLPGDKSSICEVSIF